MPALLMVVLTLSPVPGRAQTVSAAESPAESAAAPAGAAGPRLPASAPQEWGPFPTTALLAPPVSQDPALRPAAELPPPFLVKLDAELKERWTDNVYLSARQRSADGITTLTPSLKLSNRTRHLDLGLDYKLSYDRYALNDDQSGFRHSGLGLLNSELVEDRVFVDLRGSISEQAANPTAPSVAAERSSSVNSTRVGVYSITPRWREKIGDAVLTQVSVGHDRSQTLSASTGADGGTGTKLHDTSSNRAKIEASSGESFTQMLWNLSSSAVQSEQSGGGGLLTQAAQQLGLEARLNTDFGLLSSVGFDTIHGQGVASDKIGGLFLIGGVHWTPSPDTDLRVGLGRRYGQTSPFAMVEHKLGPRTTLRLAQEVSIVSDALSQFQALSAVQRDDQGNFVNPFSGLTADPGRSALNRSNAVSRQETSSLMLRRAGARDTITMTGSLTQQDILSNPSSSSGAAKGSHNSVLSLTLGWIHRLSEDAAFHTQARYSDTLEVATGGKRDQVALTLGLDYALTETLSAGLAYDVQLSSGDQSQTTALASFANQNGDVLVNTASLFLRRKF